MAANLTGAIHALPCGCETAPDGTTYTQTAWPYATLPGMTRRPCDAHTPAWQRPGFVPSTPVAPVHADWEARLLASIR